MMDFSFCTDVFPETCIEAWNKNLEEKISEVNYVSTLLINDDTTSDEMAFALYFNEHEGTFEYYFRDYSSMGCVIGIGLEYAKVILEDDECKLKVVELTKTDSEDGFGGPSLKVSISKVFERTTDRTSLLWDVTMYFFFGLAKNFNGIGSL